MFSEAFSHIQSRTERYPVLGTKTILKTYCLKKCEPPVGVEPTTYCLQDSRSDQLS